MSNTKVGLHLSTCFFFILQHLNNLNLIWWVSFALTESIGLTRLISVVSNPQLHCFCFVDAVLLIFYCFPSFDKMKIKVKEMIILEFFCSSIQEN